MAAPAAPTLGVTVNEAAAAVDCTVGVTTGTTKLYVERSTDGSAWTPVRGANPRAITTAPASVVVTDYEVPLGVAATYRAAVANAAGEASAAVSAGPVTVGADALDDPWLVDLANPANSQQVLVERLADLAHFVPTGVHNVIGRVAPIVTSDVAKAPTFELAFVTADLAARDKARATLTAGAVVLLRTPEAQGVGELYFAVIGWSEQRPSRVALTPDRRFLVTAQEVDAPAP